MITLLKSISFNVLDRVAPAPQLGTVYALPVIATQLTWQAIFTGSPAAISIQLLLSNDGIVFDVVDTSTSTTGESRTLATSAAFIRANILSITPGASTAITVSVIAEPGKGGSSTGGGSSVQLHAPTHFTGATDPVDVTKLAGYPGNNTTFLRADGTFAAPSGGIPTAHAPTHSIGGSDPLVNAAWTNLANTFTQQQSIYGNYGGIKFRHDGAAVDQKQWALYTTGVNYVLGTLNDAGNVEFDAVVMDRLGNATYTGNQLISKLRPDLQLRYQGDTSKSHLEATTPNNLILSQNLFYDGTQWNKDDTTIPGSMLDLVNGSIIAYTSPAGLNPAVLTQILNISPSGNLTIPGSISAAGGLAPGPHHTTHEPGGNDVIANVAWLNLKNTFTKEQTIVNEAGDVVARFALMNMTNPLNQRKWLFWAYQDFLGLGQFFDDESSGQPSFEFHRDGRFVIPAATNPRILFSNQSQVVDQKTFDVVNTGALFIISASNDAMTASSGYVQMDRSGVWTASSGLGTTPLNASQLTSGTLPDARLSTNVAFKNIDNNFAAQTFGAGSVIEGGNSLLYFRDTSAPLDNRIWRFVNYSDGPLRLEAYNDALSIAQAQYSWERNGRFTAAYLSGDGQFLTNINAASIATGLVNPARLGNGSPNSSTFLRGDGVWASVPAGDAFPSGLIVISDAPCPPGWTRVNWDGFFLRSGPVIGAQGGSYTHSHGAGSFVSQGHTHGKGTLSTDGHNHGGQTGAVNVSGSTSGVGDHNHTVNLGFSSTAAADNTNWTFVNPGSTNQVSFYYHTHTVNGTVAGNTGDAGAHSHTFSGSGTGSIPMESPGISGATAVAGALPITGTSDIVDHQPPFLDIFYCRKN